MNMSALFSKANNKSFCHVMNLPNILLINYTLAFKLGELSAGESTALPHQQVQDAYQEVKA